MAKENNQDRVLAALLTCSTIKAAAKKAKVSEASIYRYLADEEFKSRYRAARREVVEKSICTIQKAMDDAANTLKRNLTCAIPSVEIRAAQILIDAGIKDVDSDLLERLEALENAQP